MSALKLSILTNMVAPYRVPFFRALAADERVVCLRILTCVEREADRQWQVDNDSSYHVQPLAGVTLNLKRGNDARRILHFRFGIFWELLRHRPDRLVIGDASWTSYLAAFACWMLGIRYLVWNEITTSSQVSTGLVAHLRRWMYKGADQLIASCQMAKDFLLRNGVDQEKIRIVLNAVDNDFFLAQRQQWEPKRSELRSELGIAEDAFCFIYVGQLISRKRVLETVELLAETAKKRPLHLLVVGTGPLEAQMRSKAQELNFSTISFCGYATPECLSQLYIASDALILLSKDEPWGMVVNEALLFNKGCITSESVAASMEFLYFSIVRSITYEDINTECILSYIDNYPDSEYVNFEVKNNSDIMVGGFINGC